MECESNGSPPGTPPGTPGTHILDWSNICVTEEKCNKIKLDDLSICLLQKLHEHFTDEFQADVVLIENQPALKNGQMKSVSIMLYTYFNLLKIQFGNICDVKFISATNKLKCQLVPKSADIKNYNSRKKVGIEVTKLYIRCICPEKEAWFDSMKKGDDVSDAFLQAVYYIEAVLKIVVAKAVTPTDATDATNAT